MGKNEELAMPVFALNEAKNKVRDLTPELDKHLIKLVVFGDRKSWRQEIFAWAQKIYNIRVNLSSRKRLSAQEYLDCMQEFEPNEVNNFNNWVLDVERSLVPKIERRISLKEARFKVHSIQQKLAVMWSSGNFSRSSFSYYLDSVLYEEI